MKIIYLHQYFKTPSMAGGTRSYEMARRLVSAGHEVHVVTSRTDQPAHGGSWSQEVIEGIQVHWLPVTYSNSMGFVKRLQAFFRFALKAGKYASSIKADVVFATSTPLTIAIPGVKAARAIGAPMVFEVRDLWPEIPIALGVLRSPVTQFFAKKLESWAYRNSNQIVGLSSGMCEGIVRTGYPRERVHLIPNSSDMELFSVPKTLGAEFRQARPWLEDRPLVVYAGTFGKVNGVGYLVEVAKHSLSLDPEVRFLAVGEGAEWSEVEQKAELEGVLNRNFFMEPAVTKAEMPALLNAATLTTSLVINNKALWHNSANKFFDSLAAGRPIFVNHGGWQAELLAKSGAGFQTPANDPAAAAELIVTFIKNPGAADAAGLAALKLARTEFDRARLANKLEHVLKLAVGDSVE